MKRLLAATVAAAMGMASTGMAVQAAVSNSSGPSLSAGSGGGSRKGDGKRGGHAKRFVATDKRDARKARNRARARR